MDVFYGYLKDPEDYHKLVINPETAPIVQDIFQWYVYEGMNKNAIARKLIALGIQHRHPAVMRDVHSLSVVRRRRQHVPQDHPDIQEWNQRHQRAEIRENPRGIGKDPVSARVFHQPGEIRLFFQGDSPSFLWLVVANWCIL